MTKLFGSFQQYATNLPTTNTSISPGIKSSSKSLLSLTSKQVNDDETSVMSTLSPAQEQLLISTNNHHSSFENQANPHISIGYNVPSNIVEVHKIVAFTEYKYSMISIFFENLIKFTNNYATKFKTFKEEIDKWENGALKNDKVKNNLRLVMSNKSLK